MSAPFIIQYGFGPPACLILFISIFVGNGIVKAEVSQKHHLWIVEELSHAREIVLEVFKKLAKI